MVDYGGLQYFIFFYRVLSCFIIFCFFLLAEMPENDQKWSEMTENGYGSIQKFMKVHESSRKSTLASNGVGKSKTGKVYRPSKKSKGFFVAQVGVTWSLAQSSTPSVRSCTHSFCQPDLGKTKALMAKYSILSSERAWQM